MNISVLEVPSISNLTWVTVTSSEREAEFLSFKLLNKRLRMRLSPEPLDLNSLDGKGTYYVTANEKGWFIAVARDSGGQSSLLFSPLQDLRREIFTSTTEGEVCFEPQRNLALPTVPCHIALVLNEDRLAVSFSDGSISIYDTSLLFSSGSNSISAIHTFPPAGPGPIKQIVGNPADLPELLAVRRDVRNDANGLAVEIIDVRHLKSIGGWTASADAIPTSINWSTKGKQLAIGLQSGDILTFSPSSTSSPKLHVPKPDCVGDASIVTLMWLANTIFYGIYIPSGRTDPDAPQKHVVLYYDPKSTSVTQTELQVPYYASPGLRPPGAFTTVMRNWLPMKTMVIFADSTSSDIGVVAQISEDDGTEQWENLSLEETSTPSVPLDREADDTVPLGLDIDITSEGVDDKTAAPVLYVYASDGTVQAWTITNSKTGPYPGMIVSSTQNTTSDATIPTTPNNRAQSSLTLPAQGVPKTPTFGSTGFGTPAFGKPSPKTPTFGQTAFGQSLSATPSGQPPAVSSFGSSFGQSGFGAFASQGPSKFGQSGFSFGKPSGFGTTSSSVAATNSSTAFSAYAGGSKGFSSFTQGGSSVFGKGHITEPKSDGAAPKSENSAVEASTPSEQQTSTFATIPALSTPTKETGVFSSTGSNGVSTKSNIFGLQGENSAFGRSGQLSSSFGVSSNATNVFGGGQFLSSNFGREPHVPVCTIPKSSSLSTSGLSPTVDKKPDPAAPAPSSLKGGSSSSFSVFANLPPTPARPKPESKEGEKEEDEESKGGADGEEGEEDGDGGDNVEDFLSDSASEGEAERSGEEDVEEGESEEDGTADEDENDHDGEVIGPTVEENGKPVLLKPPKPGDGHRDAGMLPSTSLFGQQTYQSTPAPTKNTPSGLPPVPQITRSQEQHSFVSGMQKECHVLCTAMVEEFEQLQKMSHAAALTRTVLGKPSSVAHTREDLKDRTKWSFGDLEAFGKLVKSIENDVMAVYESNKDLVSVVREIESNLLKAETRKEEIARFSKAKADPDFAKMLKTRTLGPEAAETQSHLRKQIRAIENRVEQLESYFKAARKKLGEHQKKRKGIKPPSLDTVNRTYRNIDKAIKAQTSLIEELATRVAKLKVDDSSAPARNAAPSNLGISISSASRVSRFPVELNDDRSRISVSPTIAASTASALNAERSALRLKNALLKARKEPLLNTQAIDTISRAPTLESARKAVSQSVGGKPWLGSLDLAGEYMHDVGHRGRLRNAKHENSVKLGKTHTRVPSDIKTFDWGPLPSAKPLTSLPVSLLHVGRTQTP